MRFRVEHRFAAPPGAVVEILLDPAFHRDLQLPDLQLLELVDHVDDGSRAMLSLRYEYVGHVDPLVQRLLGGRRPTWVQELALDRVTGAGRLGFAVEGHGDRLHGGADLTVQADGDETVWEVEGELWVRVPLVGRAGERRLVDGVVRRLDVEARELAERL